MKLHDLTDTGLKLAEIIEGNPDIDISKALTDFQMEFNEKVVSLGMIYRNYIAEAEVYGSESKRLSEKEKVLKNRAESLRVYMEQQMDLLGIESIKGNTFAVRFRKLPPLVQIEDLDLIPAGYKRIIPQNIEPDKRKILEDLSNGLIVEGASLKTDRRKLEIK